MKHHKIFPNTSAATLLAAALTIIPFAAQAGTVSTGWTKVEKFNLGSAGDRVNIIITGTLPNPANCNSQGSAQADETGPHPTNQVLSIAMAALTTDREISLDISNTACANGGRPKILGIQMR